MKQSKREKVLKPQASMGARGRYKLQVVDKSGSVVQERPWQKNLILDVGLNRIAQTSWADCFVTACAGTGGTPTQDDSAAITASQTGTTVTLSEAFAAVSAGKLIKWDSGEEALVVSGSDTTWTVDRSQSVSAGEFTVYRVDQTKLATWVKNTDEYLEGSENCGSVVSAGSGTLTMKRTFDFSVESGSVNYSEVGVTWATEITNDPDLFSRILISGGAVTVLEDQQLRLVYELTITCSPATAAEPLTADITGWPVAPASTTDGDQRWQLLGLSRVVSSGASSDFFTGGDGMEPSELGGTTTDRRAGGITDISTAPAAFGSSVNRGTSDPNVAVGCTSEAYATGSFERVTLFTIPANIGNATTYRAVCIGNSPTSSNRLIAAFQNTNFVFVFDEAQTKDDEHLLTIRFRLSWGRDLS